VRWTPPTIRLLVDIKAAQLPLSLLGTSAVERISEWQDVGDEGEGAAAAVKGPKELEGLVCSIKVRG